MSFTSASAGRRDLWIAVAARAISQLGDEAAIIALTLRLHDSGEGAGAIAALFAAGMLPLVVLAPVAGVLVDRYDSRRLLVWSGLAQAGVCAALAGVHSVPALLALVALLGAGQAVNGATWQALLPSIVGDEGLPAAMGLSAAARTGAGIVAPAVGGLLTARYGAATPLLLDAVTFAAITAGGLLIRTRRHVREAPRPGRGGYRAIRDDPVLLALVALLAAFIALGAMVNVVDVFLVRDTLHSTATWYGVIGASWGAGMLLGSLLGGRCHGQRALVRLLLAGAIALAASLAGYAIVPAVAWLVPFAVAGGAGNGALNLGAGALTMVRAPEHVRGRVSAAVNGVASAAMVGALALGGALATVASPRQIFLAAAAFGLLAPLTAGRLLLRAVAEPPTTPAPVPSAS